MPFHFNEKFTLATIFANKKSKAKQSFIISIFMKNQYSAIFVETFLETASLTPSVAIMSLLS